MPDNGRECRPGDRGDAKMRKAVASVSSGGSPDMPSKLKGELSKGYEKCGTGWKGNVKR